MFNYLNLLRNTVEYILRNNCALGWKKKFLKLSEIKVVVDDSATFSHLQLVQTIQPEYESEFLKDTATDIFNI